MKKKEKTVDKLLQPSWLSGLIAVLAAILVTFGVIVAFNFNNSQIQQQLTSWQNTTAPAALTLPGQSPSSDTTNSLQDTWPLIGFWMIIGLIAYFAVEAAVRGLSEVAEFRRELDYVHARRGALIRSAVEAVFIRLLAAILWIIFIEFFFKRVVPYSILASHATASDPISPVSFVYAALSFSLIALSLHLHTIFLRLMAGRVRLFSIG
jgi:amino acid transporter